MTTPGLQQVYSACNRDHEIGVDIIAIHGINTNPSRSFTAYQEEGNNQSREVRWLSDEDMLPAVLKGLSPARIFTYSWESNTFHDASDDSFKTQAETLLQKINEFRCSTRTAELPIIFIASCFGGLLLAKALVWTSIGVQKSPYYKYVLSQTKRIVFLGTPFRGSDAMEAAKYRAVLAGLLGSKSSVELLQVLENGPRDGELTDPFVDLLVSRQSACLDGIESWHKIELDVKHAHLNKFRGPKDPSFCRVSAIIKQFVENLPRNLSLARLLKIRRNLRFSMIQARFDEIYSDFGETSFPSILAGDTKPTTTDIPHSIRELISAAAQEFKRWIRFDMSNNIFWISGKPGCGKSTFMKFLVHHKNILRVAPEPQGLLIHHFFLLLGQSIQRSKKGLLCTLLCQLLDHFTHEEGRDLDAAEESFGHLRGDKIPVFENWTEEELEDALEKSLKALGRTRCIYTCIDGLDEFDRTGGPGPILELVSKLRGIRGVRMIVSSRPEHAFSKYFEKVPKLLMQDATAIDMYRFANKCLTLPNIDNMQRHSLAEVIVKKAEGIFLWVALVTKTLVMDLEAGNPVDTLQHVLDNLPQGMTELYSSIWMRQNKNTRAERVEAALYFQLLIDARALFDRIPGLCFQYWQWQPEIREHSSEYDVYDPSEDDRYDKDIGHRNVTLFHLAIASDETLARQLLMDSEKLGADAVLEQCKAANRAIPIRCAGVIEIMGTPLTVEGETDPEAHVRFIHRTAQEFLTETKHGNRILEHCRLRPANRFRRLIFASLGRSWSFRSHVNRHMVRYPIFHTRLHEFLVNEGIAKDRLSNVEVEEMVRYCEKLKPSRTVSVICQGLDILCSPGLPRWLMACTPQDRVRVLHFAMSWPTLEATRVCRQLLEWADGRLLIQRERAMGYTEVPASLSAFGPMKMSTFDCLMFNLARLATNCSDIARQFEDLEYFITWAKRSQARGRLENARTMSGFFFFDHDCIPSGNANGVLAGKLYPDVCSFSTVRFLIVVSFPASYGLANLLRWKPFNGLAFKRMISGLRTGNGSTGSSSRDALALGHVLDDSRFDWGANRWRARTVPWKFQERIRRLLCGEEEVSAKGIFKEMIEDGESEELGSMRDFLVQRGIVSRGAGEHSVSKDGSGKE
ncbi:hypothetical protein QBC34DRAFT_429156 [Podospora aff. communis PSN243]|uniref:NACHT domain-containing protein n=1 Tax=Podospora aff. communis PSN243 TaxID=3040156 RepID=A0AAV9GCH8_9PEZI|nr:hypothetical protein QBC34DRAFT_429156 [Podospora aff. communis PSN243]